MQKLTLTFIYGKDETRKLKYRLTGDIPVGVMMEKLIGFQFVIDCADPKTFHLMHNGKEITDLSKTFEECGIIDGDEIYLMPTVYEPIPPLPEKDLSPQKPKSPQRNDRRPRQNAPSGERRQNEQRSGGSGNSGRRHHANSPRPQADKPQAEKPRTDKPQTEKAPSAEGEKKSVPFKPRRNNYHRGHSRSSGAPKQN